MSKPIGRALMLGIGGWIALQVVGCTSTPPRAELNDLTIPDRMCPVVSPATAPSASAATPGKPASTLLHQAVQKASAAHRRSRHPATRPAHDVSGSSESPSTDSQPIEMLCLSGGGQYGAFGAGFLKGWSASTSSVRPRSFDVVTGVSTGSLISSYAFIGPKKDDEIVQLYRDTAVGEPVFKLRFMLGFLMTDSLATRQGLEDRIGKAITPELLREVAGVAGDDSRALLVGTVNLDTGKMTYWSLSRIAQLACDKEKKDPKKMEAAVDLYQTILLAATAIPGALSPVLIDRDRYKDFFDADPCKPIVSPDWSGHSTLHADGGTRQNIFAVDVTNSLLALRAAGQNPPVHIHLIANGTLLEATQVTPDSLFSIGSRAIDLLLTEAMRGNLASIALLGSVHGWTVDFAYLQLSPKCQAIAEKLNLSSSFVDTFNADFINAMIDDAIDRGQHSKNPWNNLSDLGLPQPASR